MYQNGAKRPSGELIGPPGPIPSRGGAACILTLNDFVHRQELDGQTRLELVEHRSAGRVAPRAVKIDAGQHGHQLEPGKAAPARFRFAALEQRGTDSLSHVGRIDEKRPDLRGIPCGIQLGRVAMRTGTKYTIKTRDGKLVNVDASEIVPKTASKTNAPAL